MLPVERNACLPGCVWNATPRSLSPLERNTLHPIVLETESWATGTERWRPPRILGATEQGDKGHRREVPGSKRADQVRASLLMESWLHRDRGREGETQVAAVELGK